VNLLWKKLWICCKIYQCTSVFTYTLHWSQTSSEEQFNNYALHVYTLLTIFKHFISCNVLQQCMQVFRLSQHCSWDLCFCGTTYHVTRRSVTDWGGATSHMNRDLRFWDCWHFGFKFYQRILTLSCKDYETSDKTLWTHSTDHKVVEEASILYTKTLFVKAAASGWVHRLSLFQMYWKLFMLIHTSLTLWFLKLKTVIICTSIICTSIICLKKNACTITLSRATQMSWPFTEEMCLFYIRTQ
jgi:hypothetical protein